ncbi:MAG TPA: energy-coupled thiamine transporter ThiT [Pseudogracilibacillus sp.]|nr:energy-coupled thiamine transporter ThiT [Pseudogracilibacillus sp.]
MQRNKTLMLIEIAIFTALALILDIIPFLNFKIWPAGGSISLAMIPVFILAFRWGLKAGLTSGFLWGMLQIAVGNAYILHFLQGAIEYGLAFTVLGFAGVFSKQIQQAVKEKNTRQTFTYITYGVLLGASLRFLCHFVAGFVFFASSAEFEPAWLYSLVYNISYMLPAAIISLFAIFFLFNSQARTIIRTA